MSILDVLKLKNKGFSLVETLITIAIFSFIAVLIMQSFSNTVSYVNNIDNHIKIQNEVNYGMVYIKRIIRESAYTSLNYPTNHNSTINNCSYIGLNPGICSPSNQFNLYSASGSVIGCLEINNNILEYFSGSCGNGNISVDLNSKSVIIKNVMFYYDNYNLSGTPSNASVYILPYVTVVINACSSTPDYEYGFIPTTPCSQLISTATNENYIYS